MLGQAMGDQDVDELVQQSRDSMVKLRRVHRH